MPNPTKPTTNLTREELLKLISDQIVSPNVKSEISTSDIRVMGISSTGLHDRAISIMQLFDTYTQAKEREARIEQSYRCRELIEANANSPEDAERYGEIVLLDVDDLVDELQDELESRNA